MSVGGILLNRVHCVVSSVRHTMCRWGKLAVNRKGCVHQFIASKKGIRDQKENLMALSYWLLNKISSLHMTGTEVLRKMFSLRPHSELAICVAMDFPFSHS